MKIYHDVFSSESRMALRNLLVALDIKANYFKKYGINGSDMGVFMSNAKDEDIMRNISEDRQHKLAGIIAKAMDTIVSSRRADANFDSINRKYNDWFDLAFNRAILPMSSGGIITSKFPNYVERECDTSLKNYIYDANCNLIVVRGPFMSGKSSMLANAKCAIDNSNDNRHATFFIDFNDYMALRQGRGATDILSYLIIKIKDNIFCDGSSGNGSIEALKNSNDEISVNKFKLLLSNLRERLGNKKLVLFLDNVDKLARPSDDKSFLNSQELLLNFIRDISQDISMHRNNWPLEISIVAVFCEHYLSSDYVSILETRGPVMYTTNLTQYELLSLSEVLSARPDLVKLIWQFCQGHPYVSHKIMEKITSGVCTANSLINIMFSDPDLIRFVYRVCDEFKVIIGSSSSDELYNLLIHLSDDNIHAIFRSSRKVNRLAALGLLVNNDNKLSICRFYKNFLVRLLCERGSIDESISKTWN